MLPRINSVDLESSVEVPTVEPKPKSSEQLEKESKYQAYLLKFSDRIKQWKESHWRHPGIHDNPPIVWDSSIKDYVWMNRSWRRA